MLTVDLAICKALNSLQTMQQTLNCPTCLFSCLFARFEGVADDPHLWVVHALICPFGTPIITSDAVNTIHTYFGNLYVHVHIYIC